LVSLALYFRTQRFYKLVVLKRLKHYAPWWRMYLPAFYHKVVYKGLCELWILPVLYVQFKKDMHSIILSIIICHCCLWLWAWFFTYQIICHCCLCEHGFSLIRFLFVLLVIIIHNIEPLLMAYRV
jgi:hypothetical protein